jgi:hypothetical protein
VEELQVPLKIVGMEIVAVNIDLIEQLGPEGFPAKRFHHPFLLYQL